MFTLEGVHGEQYGLLKSIFDNPDDDTVRLVYADWLDGRGGAGDAEHAEFIRVQVALAAGRDDGELFTRQRELALTILDWDLPGFHDREAIEYDRVGCSLMRHRFLIRRDVPRRVDTLQLVFRRGFPEINHLIVGAIYPGRMVYLGDIVPPWRRAFSWEVNFDWRLTTTHMIRSFPDHDGVVIVNSTLELDIDTDPIEATFRGGTIPTFLSSFGRVLVPSGQPSSP